MKWKPSLIGLVALGLLALATPAWAQKEQWLEYHTDREGRGYRYLDLSTNAPANVALPKLNAQPYFVRWTSPMEPNGGRWICFDRTRKAGPHDRVYIDTNGNGRLDDDAPVNTFRTDQYSAYFDPAKVVFKGEDGPITYHLALRFMKYDGSDVRVLASSAGYYAGQVDLGGKKVRLELIDGNVNGTFNDRSANSGECDRVSVSADKDSGDGRYLGKLIEVGNQFYQIEAARDGAFVKLQKADITLGQVRVPETISEFVAFGENGHFVRKPAKGEFTLPTGKYHILQWTINRKDNKGANWELMGYNLPDKAKFEVAAAQPASIQVGEPIRAELKGELTKGQYAFNLNFRGRFDESIQILKASQRPPGPKLSFASADGSYRATNTFEFG